MPKESASTRTGRRPRYAKETDTPYEYPSYRHLHGPGYHDPLHPEDMHFGGGYRDFSGDEQKDLYGEPRQGPYEGVGPKGYKRSDERILEDVSERFMEDSHLDPSSVEVEVRGGEVFLKGSVPVRYMKRLAEDIAVSALGVKDVQNQLRVKED